jgi:stress response protein YsnF
MTTTEELQNMEGQTAVDANGAKLGKIGQIYVDDQTGQPLWVTITTGMFGTKQSFAPLHGSRPDGGDLHLAVTKDMVTDAPGVEADGHIEDSENEALYTYYSGYLDGTTQDQGQVYAGDTREDMAGRDGIAGQDTSGPATDDAMTRSEERLRVGTEQAEAGRVRLRKYVVTENVTQTVPVSHEEVRLEREPITDASRGQAIAGADITEEEHDVTLHLSVPSWPRRPSRSSGSGSARKPSPRIKKSARRSARSRLMTRT